MNTSSRWPSDDALSWAMVADHLVVVEATDERVLPPDDQLKLRQFTFVVEDVLWSRADAVELPETISWPVWGWARHGDEGEWSEMNAHDRPRIEEGQRYLMAVLWSPAVPGITEGWGTLGGRATIRLVGATDELDKESILPNYWTNDLDTTDEVAAVLRDVTPKAQSALTDAKASKAARDPEQRALAWLRWWKDHGLGG